MSDCRLHACALFDSSNEKYDVLAPFIRESLKQGEKALHIVGAAQCQGHLQHLRDAGIDVDQTQRSGQFELQTWGDVYFNDGRFEIDRVLAAIQSYMQATRAAGYPRMRLISHMDWASEAYPGSADLLECETRFNLVPNPGDPVICVYDLAKFRADVIIDLIRTHPIMVIGATLQENPFFVPPQQMLAELRARG